MYKDVTCHNNNIQNERTGGEEQFLFAIEAKSVPIQIRLL